QGIVPSTAPRPSPALIDSCSACARAGPTRLSAPSLDTATPPRPPTIRTSAINSTSLPISARMGPPQVAGRSSGGRPLPPSLSADGPRAWRRSARGLPTVRGSEEPTLTGRRRGPIEVLVRARRGESPPRRAVEEAGLEEERLDEVLDRAAVLAERRREGLD